MSRRNILVLTSAYQKGEGSFHNLIMQLIEVPEKDRSPREQDIIDRMIEFGELYPMEISEVPPMESSSGNSSPGWRQYVTDLGQPDEQVLVRLPLGIDEKKAAALVQLLAEGLMA